MNLTIISNTIQIQYCRHEKFHKCITEPIIMPTSSTINSQRQEIQILELPNPYLVIPTKLKLNLVLNSDTISRSLEQTHGWTTPTSKYIKPELGMSTWIPLTDNHKKRSCADIPDKPPMLPCNVGFIIYKSLKTCTISSIYSIIF